MERISTLWKPPAVNPVNSKALSVPLLNPVDKYGRTLYFSTFGFMIAFLSWYAFPPLMTITIKKDLALTQTEIANSNILALVATLLVRVVIGPLCDRYGARKCFAGVLLAGALPTVLAGTTTSATGLIVLRFFIGILGGTFVPCQVWMTGFFDKKVVGYANALAGGIGNAGGGITYFVMPAVFDSLVHNQHLTPHKAWRVAFIVPFILITAIACGMLLFGEDTPTGAWAARRLHAEENIHKVLSHGVVIDVPGGTTPDVSSPSAPQKLKSEKPGLGQDLESNAGTDADVEAAASIEIVHKPSVNEAAAVVFSLQCFALAAQYAASFGGELSINSILGSYYEKNFPRLGQTGSGNWAAMFGLLNLVFRPIGGLVADWIYRATGTVWGKKLWLVFVGVVTGAFCIAIGSTDAHTESTMFGLFVGLAFFLEAANGANYALVPHVFPFANGIVSGVVGAAGNLGGIVFAVVFRYNGTDYARVFWIIGIIICAVNLAVCWIKPVSTKQIVGRPHPIGT